MPVLPRKQLATMGTIQVVILVIFVLIFPVNIELFPCWKSHIVITEETEVPVILRLGRVPLDVLLQKLGLVKPPDTECAVVFLLGVPILLVLGEPEQVFPEYHGLTEKVFVVVLVVLLLPLVLPTPLVLFPLFRSF